MGDGQPETDISRRAERQAADRLAGVLAGEGHLGGAATVHASFRSGPRTAMPHAMMGNRPIERGDNLVSYCVATVAGYHTELERTMFLGQPTARQQELMEVVHEAQQLALDMLRPGLRCADVEARVHNFLVGRGYEAFIRHHTGHGLGLESHEAPFFDLGDQTVLQPGMVFSVEPGLYVPGLGGFRNSDTVALTETGVEILTEYPRLLADLVIEI
jgi:Xaa-Pro aminopeptidase